MNNFVEEWIELTAVLRPATKREEVADTRNINWDELNQIVLGSTVVLGCKLIELANLKNIDEHSKVLFKIRNAYVHNGNDISINNDRLNKDAEQIVDDYIQQYGDTYFVKDTHKQIIYKDNVLNLIKFVLLQDYSEI